MPAIGDVLLDTSVAVAHLRGIQSVTARFILMNDLYLPIVAYGELLCGIRKSARAEENLASLQSWLQTVTLLSLTEATAQRYASLKLQLAAAGTPIPENDIWIAAHALELGIPLAARDEHFSRIAGLNLLDWR